MRKGKKEEIEEEWIGDSEGRGSVNCQEGKGGKEGERKGRT